MSNSLWGRQLWHLGYLLPKIQLEKFDGNISMFRIFRKPYQSIVESNLINDSEESKLVYLLNYLKGEPEKWVQSCMFLNKDKYVRAWLLKCILLSQREPIAYTKGH